MPSARTPRNFACGRRPLRVVVCVVSLAQIEVLVTSEHTSEEGIDHVSSVTEKEREHHHQ